MGQGDELIVHASTVAHGGRAVLILGPSGSGKSGMALQLMAMGAALVADDRTVLFRDGPLIRARAPAAIRGRIEARGVGILWAEPQEDAPLALAVDLGQQEDARLPPHREMTLLGVALPLLYRIDAPHFCAAVLQWLRSGGRADDV